MEHEYRLHETSETLVYDPEDRACKPQAILRERAQITPTEVGLQLLKLSREEASILNTNL